MNSVRILGIDPGTAITGWGVIEGDAANCSAIAYGAVRTDKEEARADRLKRIHAGLQAIIALHQPQLMAVEKLFFTRNVSTAMAVGEARGIVLLAASQAGIEAFEYTPTDVKQSISGSGRAQKGEMQHMVQWHLALPAPPRPDDVADALAIALCHLFHARLRRYDVA